MILSLWEDLIKNNDLMDKLKVAHEDFRLIDRSTFFWYPRVTDTAGSPSNPIEALAELVVERVKPAKLAGVEYWTNSLGEGEIMHPHKDKDERLYWSKKELRHPDISTVFYPGFIPFTGGELVVDRRHLVNPGPNQLAAFRGDLEHGVQKVKSGTRHSIALNLWSVTPSAYGTA